jgi:hypothetical protein
MVRSENSFWLILARDANAAAKIRHKLGQSRNLPDGIHQAWDLEQSLGYDVHNSPGIERFTQAEAVAYRHGSQKMRDFGLRDANLTNPDDRIVIEQLALERAYNQPSLA